MWGNLSRPLAALADVGIVTVDDAIKLQDTTGESLADALATIKRVGKPASEAIAEGIDRHLRKEGAAK